MGSSLSRLTERTNVWPWLLLAPLGIYMLVFFVVYTRVTPYDEVKLIRQGNQAAALSLGGALIGLAMTMASALLHTSNLVQFAAWSAGAMVVQLVVYASATRLLSMSKDQIEHDNRAWGGFLAALSLSIGLINAGCVS